MKKHRGMVFVALYMSSMVYAMNNDVVKNETKIIDARKANIKGLSKVKLLKRLFKEAQPHLFKDLLTISLDLSHDEAVKTIKEQKFIGELNGKTLNINLSEDVVDTSGYNKANGHGKHLAEKIINQMRKEKKY